MHNTLVLNVTSKCIVIVISLPQSGVMHECFWGPSWSHDCGAPSIQSTMHAKLSTRSTRYRYYWNSTVRRHSHRVCFDWSRKITNKTKTIEINNYLRWMSSALRSPNITLYPAPRFALIKFLRYLICQHESTNEACCLQTYTRLHNRGDKSQIKIPQPGHTDQSNRQASPRGRATRQRQRKMVIWDYYGGRREDSKNIL